MTKTNVNIELSIDDFWLIHEAIGKRIENLREHIAYLTECLAEIEDGKSVPMIGGGQRGKWNVTSMIENFEGQIRKHEWLLQVPFNVDLLPHDDDEDDE